MTTNVEGTTMDFVAKWMWLLTLTEVELEQQPRWDDLPREEQSNWHRKAVTIIDAAEPIWAERVRKARDKGIWDHAIRTVQEKINENVPITAETVLSIENPYA